MGAIKAGPHEWSEGDRRNLSDLAFGVSAELRARIAAADAADARRRADEARLVAERSTARFQVLGAASDALNETLDPDSALVHILDVAVPQLGSWAASR